MLSRSKKYHENAALNPHFTVVSSIILFCFVLHKGVCMYSDNVMKCIIESTEYTSAS